MMGPGGVRSNFQAFVKHGLSLGDRMLHPKALSYLKLEIFNAIFSVPIVRPLRGKII